MRGQRAIRCILFNETGEICSMAQKEFRQFFPNPGWVEHDANEIWSTQLGVAVEAMLKIGAKASDIAAIGITNQRETAIVWNKETRRTDLQCDRMAVQTDGGYRGRIKEKRPAGRVPEENRAYHRCVLFRDQDQMDPGSCGGSENARRRRKAVVWNGRDPG